MGELTTTVGEARNNFSKIASVVDTTKRPVVVFRNSRPWVKIAPLDITENEALSFVDWSKIDVKKLEKDEMINILPSSWNDEEDEGLYDSLV